MTVTIRTHDRNKSELLKIMRDSARFGQSLGATSPQGEIEHIPMTVWYDEAPELPPERFDYVLDRVRADIYSAWGVPNLG